MPRILLAFENSNRIHRRPVFRLQSPYGLLQRLRAFVIHAIRHDKNNFFLELRVFLQMER